MKNNRRDFLTFTGRASALLFLSSCVTPGSITILKNRGPAQNKLQELLPSFEDQLLLAPGFSSKILISWNDPISDQEFFGFNNDFIAYIPFDEKKPYEGYLWVNHEYVHSYFVSGHNPELGQLKTKEQIDIEMKAIGGSILHIKKDLITEEWSILKNSPKNRRINGNTPIPFAKNISIKGSNTPIGTYANCAGGITPWKTFLSCEENYYLCFGETVYDGEGNESHTPGKLDSAWDHIYKRPPEHYGWIIEINPFTGELKKHTSMGRFSHEGACVTKAKDGRIVVYMGDDKADECFYKFISKTNNSLDEGTLYVASLEQKKWIPLTHSEEPLKSKFNSQLDILIRTREAASLMGGSKLDRPEDCEIDPVNGAIYLNCTNNSGKKRPYGMIYKFVEKNNDYASLEFESSLFLQGSEDSKIVCPDNMAFDKKGNMWVTSDMSGEKMGTFEFKNFGNNALFYIPMNGPDAGIPFRVAQGPVDSELTGPCFSPDGKTLFLSVQHPGELSNATKITSHWPGGGSTIPKPSVVAITLPSFLL